MACKSDTAGILMFDFELSIGDRVQKKKSLQFTQAASSSTILGILVLSKVA
jgi:hypothetical protein